MATQLIPFGTRPGLFHDFRKEMDDLMGRFFTNENGGETAQMASWAPRLNLSETETQYELSLDLPGVKPDDVNVELRQGELWITGTRQAETEEKDKTWHRIERYWGQFRRVVRLGDDVDSEHVDAQYKDGVLHITVPKSAQAQTRKITIKS
jgi:HSP20 family protein